LGVLRPLKIIIDNYPDGQVEELECANHPQKPEMGTRKLPFSKVLYIERDDFDENPPKKYKRLAPGKEVRLRSSYIIKHQSTLKDEKTGEVVGLHCTYDPETRNGPPQDGRKVEGVIHWVSAEHAIPVEVRLYDRLFQVADPAGSDQDFVTLLNPSSLEILNLCHVEPSLKDAAPGSGYQFGRLGYFCVDVKDSNVGRPVFNRIVQLRESWGKISGKK
jgi:glutaminyl-tRNA synthetase